MTDNVQSIIEDRPADRFLLSQSARLNSSTVDSLPIRYRVRFAKMGLLRWIGHHDLARLWERMSRRVGLKLSMTEGFRPKPRIAFPSALALGIESLDEVVEIELSESITPQEMLERLTNDQQPGLHITSVKQLPLGFGKAQLSQSEYRITPPDDADLGHVSRSIQSLLAQESLTIARKNKTVSLRTDEQIVRLEIIQAAIALTLAAADTASMRVEDVLDLLGLNDWTDRGGRITRTRVQLEKEFETDDRQQIATNAAPLLA